MDIIAKYIADKFDDVEAADARTFAKRFIHENICASTAAEQAYEWALVDATLERAARFQDGTDSDDDYSGHNRL